MKRKLIIHNPTNYITKTYRYYNIFFDNLVAYLKKDYDIIENRYYIDSHKNRFPVKLLHDETNSDYTTLLLECELIIEDYDTKKLKVLSVSDYYTDANLGLFNSDISYPFLSKILISQFNRKSLNLHSRGKSIDQIYSPWIYFPSNLYDLNSFYKQRLAKTELINKLYFRGSGFAHRPILQYLDQNLYHGGHPIGNFDSYADEAINYAIGFSCAGSAQFCYRDIEYMALGIPMLRFKYTNEMNPNLIPNHHYLSVEPPLDLYEEHRATQEHAQAIMDRFLGVINNTELLHFIQNNARQYYLDYIDDISGIQHTVDILNLSEW
jgi:hypothetical protein